MRNFESEREELKEELKTLKIQNRTLVRREQELKNRLNTREKQELKNRPNCSEAKRRTVLKISNHPEVRDCRGVTIKVGDWVKILTQGRFARNEGKVVNIKKWVTSEDEGGNKQVCAPQNLVVVHDGRKHN